MISGKQAILRQELRGGARLVEARRKYNAKVQRLEGGRATPMEVLDALFDDLPHLMPLSGGGKGPSKKTIQAARKDSKWLIRLIYDMMRDTFVFLRRTGETIELTKAMEASNLRGGGGCKGRRKTKDPTCESDDRCEWVKSVGCRRKQPEPTIKREPNIKSSMPKDPPVTKEHAKKAIASKKAFDDHWFTRHVMKMTPQQREQTRQLMDEVDNVEFEKRIRNKNVLSRTYARAKRMLAKVLNMAWDLKYYLVAIALAAVVTYCAYTDGSWEQHPMHPYALWDKIKNATWTGWGWNKVQGATETIRNTAEAVQEAYTSAATADTIIPNFPAGEGFSEECFGQPALTGGFVPATALVAMGSALTGAVCGFVQNYLRGSWNTYVQTLNKGIHWFATEHALVGAVAGSLSIGTMATSATFTGLGGPALAIIGGSFGALGGYSSSYQKGLFSALSVVAAMHLTLFQTLLAGYVRVVKPSKNAQELLRMTHSVMENYTRAYSHVSTSVGSIQEMPLRIAAKSTGHHGILEANDRFVQGLVQPVVPTKWSKEQAQIASVFRTMEKDLHLLADKETKKLAKRVEAYYDKNNAKPG